MNNTLHDKSSINVIIQFHSVMTSSFYYKSTSKINYCWSLWEFPDSIIDNVFENNTFESDIWNKLEYIYQKKVAMYQT